MLLSFGKDVQCYSCIECILSCADYSIAGSSVSWEQDYLCYAKYMELSMADLIVDFYLDTCTSDVLLVLPFISKLVS